MLDLQYEPISVHT